MNATTMTAENLAQEAEHLLDTVGHFLEGETKAVQSAQFKQFLAMQTDKMSLLTRYQALVDLLKQQKSLFDKADPSIRERLKQKGAWFADIAARNRQSLEHGQISVSRLLDRIVKTTKETVKSDRVSYGRSGKALYAEQSPLSIKLNETL